MPSKTTTEYQCDRCGTRERSDIEEFHYVGLPKGWVGMVINSQMSPTKYLCPECFNRAMELEVKP